jgi:CBS domain-containing protein
MMNTAQRALRTLRASDRSRWMSGRREVSSRGTSTPLLWLGAAIATALMFALPRRAGGWLRGKRVKDVMVKSVTAIESSASLMEAAEKMRVANVGVLPVLQDGMVRGLITDRDLVVRAMARGADPRATRVGECQTDDVVCARPEWDLHEAMERMAAFQVGRLPVVDDGGRLLGIVTLASLALRSEQDDEMLDTAKEVSRRSARSA